MQDGAFPYISQLSLLPARFRKRTSASSISSRPPVIHHGIRLGAEVRAVPRASRTDTPQLNNAAPRRAWLAKCFQAATVKGTPNRVER
jgi:hypothetical protein